MYKIEYEIKLNKDGRPYINLPQDYENRSEDKFFSMELTRYLLQKVYGNRSAEFDIDAAKVIETSINLLGQVSDEMAEILYNNMKSQGDFDFILKKRYHIMVETLKLRDELAENHILYNDKIYMRQEGLRVLVLEDNIIYELENGITNENWTKLK